MFVSRLPKRETVEVKQKEPNSDVELQEVSMQHDKFAINTNCCPNFGFEDLFS